jgi:hypothetical protein
VLLWPASATVVPPASSPHWPVASIYAAGRAALAMTLELVHLEARRDAEVRICTDSRATVARLSFGPLVAESELEAIACGPSSASP